MTLMSPNILLLSIQQKYANMIFDGDKQVELRRVRPRHLKEGDLIIVYVTSPKQALVGVIEVEKVVDKSPTELWNIVGDKAGVAYDYFQKYYRNSSIGYAIFFRRKFSFDSPIKLEHLREKWSDFRPPQCYHYLKDKEIDFIQSIAKQDILSFSENPKIYQTELLAQS
ncbi:ASCH domain-containing protein [Aliinostoc sp. HNIBRCY26]|uniref:ASCH domain-containing protein n=1 Tax=Aliinostoc sp. HNIBRCY26 TaxID=3418997 RepID=UPI003D02646E